MTASAAKSWPPRSRCCTPLAQRIGRASTPQPPGRRAALPGQRRGAARRHARRLPRGRRDPVRRDGPAACARRRRHRDHSAARHPLRARSVRRRAPDPHLARPAGAAGRPARDADRPGAGAREHRGPVLRPRPRRDRGRDAALRHHEDHARRHRARRATSRCELARQRKAQGRRGHVTNVDKANVFASMAFWREVFDERAAAFPDIADRATPTSTRWR